jgi:biotin operon repressor
MQYTANGQTALNERTCCAKGGNFIMTEGGKRRDGILSLLEESDTPLSGTELAHRFKVSRQVIVQDIALLRAEDKKILSTYRGYVLDRESEKKRKCIRVFCVCHSTKDTAGISMPEELSIIGYNNSLLARCTDPEITSIDSKVEALCTTTVNTLMGVFSGANVPNRTTIASALIKRKTTNF